MATHSSILTWAQLSTHTHTHTHRHTHTQLLMKVIAVSCFLVMMFMVFCSLNVATYIIC